MGKAAREDVIPLHEQVLEALREAKSANAKPTDRVFHTMPTIRTFYLDLEQARTAMMLLENGERQLLLTARALNPARPNVRFRSLRLTVQTPPCLEPSMCNLLAVHNVAQQGTAIHQSGRTDSNRQHSAWKADALPIELRPRIGLSVC